MHSRGALEINMRVRERDRAQRLILAARRSGRPRSRSLGSQRVLLWLACSFRALAARLDGLANVKRPGMPADA
jgi:hypothetical protein